MRVRGKINDHLENTHRQQLMMIIPNNSDSTFSNESETDIRSSNNTKDYNSKSGEKKLSERNIVVILSASSF